MRSALAALSLLFLGACYSTPQPAVQPMTARAPLEAHIVPPGMGGPLQFNVSRSAYVALFYITPGAGVSLVYPAPGSGPMDGRVFSGLQSVYPRISNGLTYSFASMGYGRSYGPSYYFLIASERPLNLQQFGSYGFALHSQLGLQFSSYDAYSTMEVLAQRSLPVVSDDGTWATDMYVDWPDVIYSEPQRGLVLLQCGNYAAYVPVAYLAMARAKLCPNTNQQKPDSAGVSGDSAKIQKPKNRKPGSGIGAAPPRETHVSLLERVRRSDQLDRTRMLRRASGFDDGEGPHHFPITRPNGRTITRPMTPSSGSGVHDSGSSGSTSSGTPRNASPERPHVDRPNPAPRPVRPSTPTARPSTPHATPSSPAPRTVEKATDHGR